MLLESGADVSLVDSKGRYALQLLLPKASVPLLVHAASLPGDGEANTAGTGPSFADEGASSTSAGGASASTGKPSGGDQVPGLQTTPSAWRGFEWFHNEDRFTDIELVALDGTCVRAHRVVLAARCSLMHALLTSGMRESTANSVPMQMSGTALAALVEFIYKGTA